MAFCTSAEPYPLEIGKQADSLLNAIQSATNWPGSSLSNSTPKSLLIFVSAQIAQTFNRKINEQSTEHDGGNGSFISSAILIFHGSLALNIHKAYSNVDTCVRPKTTSYVSHLIRQSHTFFSIFI